MQRSGGGLKPLPIFGNFIFLLAKMIGKLASIFLKLILKLILIFAGKRPGTPFQNILWRGEGANDVKKLKIYTPINLRWEVIRLWGGGGGQIPSPPSPAGQDCVSGKIL